MVFRDLKNVCSPKTLLSLCLFVSGLAAFCQPSAPTSSSKPDERFTLNGMVVNTATGEPIARALVRINGMVQRTVFSDSDGHFQIDGLPASRADVSAQKPGYFNQQQLRSSGFNQLVSIGTDTGTLVVKLSPQSAIYGRVTDAAGQPVENVPVRLTARNLRDGRKRWESRGYVQTDDDGRFRIADLMPGTYYLAAGPGWEDARLLPGGAGPKIGYAGMYYPGVPDLSSASPIQLAAGQQMQADLIMNAGPVFQVSGTVTGYPAGQGFNLQFFSQSGDWLPFPVPYNPELGTFHADRVPAGSYVVKATAQMGTQSLRAELHLNVAANLENVHLTLGPAISIPVAVTMDSRVQGGGGWDRGMPPLSVRLTPLEPPASESFSVMAQGNSGRSSNYPMELQNVEPGKYAVELMPQGPWYVRSAQYGQTNLLSDLLVVTASQASAMEVVLRDDSATLTGTVRSASRGEAAATVIAVSQPASNLPVKVAQTASDGGFTLNGLAPGDYLVYAFDRSDGVEYSNPEALQPYASQATQLTLAPNQNSKVTLNLIRIGGSE
jgi:hypothetical protein